MSRRVRLLCLSAVAALAIAAPTRADITDLPVANTLTFPQLSAPVDVVRDSLGVPHVYASNLNDATFAIGYTHATDRMFQMDVFRRIPSGTLSAVLGFPDFQTGPGFAPTDPPFPGNISNLTQDLFFQTLGLRRSAVDSFNAMSPTVQSALQSYADGVNEYITRVNATGDLPGEYKLLKLTSIEPWVPVDSVVFGKLQTFELSFDFDDGPTEDLADVTDALGLGTGTTAFYQDLARSRPEENAFTVPDANNAPIPLSSLSPLADAPVMLASKAQAAEKGKTVGSDDAVVSKRGKDASLDDAKRKEIAVARKKTIQKARQFLADLKKQPMIAQMIENGAIGSNEWAVSGAVTDTGNPILANDPHLGLTSPSTFYELHINTKDRGGNLNVTGIGFAGAPGVVQGHNEDIAWGSTTNPADVTDWYLEDISSDGAGNLYSHYLGNPELITRLPLQISVNLENGNDPPGLQRSVLAGAMGLPITAQLKGVVDVTPLLANFVPDEVLIVGRHGAIFPQTLEPFPFPNNHSGGTALSVQYTGVFPTREIETFFVWNSATDLATFKSGLQLFDFGSQNWGYADKLGNIAYFTSGEFPVREDIDAGAVVGNPPWVIRDGTGGNEWKALGGPQPADQAVPYEVVPFADMPQVENPAANWFVNANNDPIGNTADNDPLDEPLAGTQPYLSPGYDEFRAARITELIKSELNLIPTPPGTPAGDGTISFADMQRMQADVNMIVGRRMAGYFVTAVDNAQLGGAPPELTALVNPTILAARNLLASWTYNTPAGFDTPGDPGVPSAQDLIDSPATTIFNVARGRLLARTFDATLAANGIGYRQGNTEAVRGLLRLLDAGTFTGVGASGLDFFEDATVPTLTQEEERDYILVRSLQDALNLLAGAGFTNAYGGSTDVNDYLWGKVHYVIFRSFVNGNLNNALIPGGGAFSIPPQPAVGWPPGKPADGGQFTVDVANFGSRPTTETGLSFGSGANRRSVVEMGPGGPVNAKNVIPGGADGRPGTPSYGNQIDLWLGNGYHDVTLDSTAVETDADARTAYVNFPGCTETGIGRCAPGKGSPKSDCTSEFFIDAPKNEDAFKKSAFAVTDGGTFDFDNDGTNDTCTVHVMICLNNNDPRLLGPDGQCASTNIDTVTVKPLRTAKKAEDAANAKALFALLRSFGPSTITGKKFDTIDFTTPITAQDTCKSTYLRIPLKSGKAGKKTFNLKYLRTDGVKDSDKVQLICNP